MRYKLQLLNTSAGTVEREWILPMPAIVGRSPDSDVPIGDASISRRHCQLLVNSEGSLPVRVFDSLNGTYVDDTKVKNRAVLKPGEIVRIGSVSIRLEWTDEELTENSAFGKASADSTQPMRTLTKDDLK